tara:strand:- start:57 stop:584 length:528 start_codon:yes stop_codon:yes gene_type:complete
MGKRSNFERKERDYYPTPIEAVRPLLEHLPKDFTFAEPCAGNGALIKHLEEKGKCMWASDSEPQAKEIYKKDYSEVGPHELMKSEYVITNPPWDRKILHPMIDHFSSRLKTWLLFDADWMHTKQSFYYMKKCSKIVSVGRVKWFGNMTGKDNCAWYLFDTDVNNTVFYGRTQSGD